MTLVLGGGASGKSDFAEKICYASGLRRVYVATSQAWDDEMRNKIFRHQAMRGDDWRTVEAPFEIAPALAEAGDGQVVLIDCLTMWLSNHLLAEHDLADRMRDLIGNLRGARAPVVLVSNEVGQGIVPDNALSREFREAQGRLNQLVAAEAELAVVVVAGLPMVLKGALPEGLA